jgi:hypothetical protein
VEDGDTPPTDCDIGVDPVHSEYTYPDGSKRVTVGVAVHAMNANGCTTTSRTQTVNVPAPPSASACETATDVGPNGDGSYHYRVGATVNANGGSCTGAIEEGDTPAAGVCEGPYTDLDRDSWDGSYHYRLGARVRAGSSCLGPVEDGDTPPTDCDLGVDPVYSEYTYPDGSKRVTVGVAVHAMNANGCTTTSRTQSVNLPALPQPTVCAADYDASPNGGGSYHVRVTLKVSSNGGGSCTGVDESYDTPSYDVVCETPDAHYAPGDDPDDFTYDVNTGVCVPGQTEPVQKGGYVEGPLQ